MDPILRLQVFERDHWQCAYCGAREGQWRDGRYVTLEQHHRLIRGQGGQDTYENLVTLCGPMPAGCHGRCHKSPAWAYENGLMIRSWQGHPSESWKPG